MCLLKHIYRIIVALLHVVMANCCFKAKEDDMLGSVGVWIEFNNNLELKCECLENYWWVGLTWCHADNYMQIWIVNLIEIDFCGCFGEGWVAGKNLWEK